MRHDRRFFGVRANSLISHLWVLSCPCVLSLVCRCSELRISGRCAVPGRDYRALELGRTRVVAGGLLLRSCVAMCGGSIFAPVGHCLGQVVRRSFGPPPRHPKHEMPAFRCRPTGADVYVCPDSPG